MSKSLDLLKIEKCIASRLRYIASAILAKEIENCFLANYTWDDIEHLSELIYTTVEVFPTPFLTRKIWQYTLFVCMSSSMRFQG